MFSQSLSIRGSGIESATVPQQVVCGNAMPDESDREPSVYAGLGQAMGLAAELVVTTFVGAGLGWLLSRWLGNAAVFLLVGTLLGGAAGISRVYRSWKRQT